MRQLTLAVAVVGLGLVVQELSLDADEPSRWSKVLNAEIVSELEAERQQLTVPGTLGIIEDSGSPFRTALGFEALLFNTTGLGNSAVGYQALRQNTLGSHNSALGFGALVNNSVGDRNSAIGYEALMTNGSGLSNTAAGWHALRSNTTGSANTSIGVESLLRSTTGNGNTSVGYNALVNNTTGESNTAVGVGAGYYVATGSYNIHVGGGTYGSVTDTNTIRIGVQYDAGSGEGQNRTFIAGIHGTQLTGSAVQVFVDANGQLGTLSPAMMGGSVLGPLVSDLQQRVQEQDAINADLRSRVARLEAMLNAGARRR